MNFLVTTITLAFLGLTSAHAQSRAFQKFTPYSEVGIGGGTASYFGELAPIHRPFRSLGTLPRWNTSISFTRHVTPHFALRTSFTWVRLIGDDFTFTETNPNQFPIQFLRNLHFRNDIKEVAISGLYQFRREGNQPNHRPSVTPYIMAGIAIVGHNPKARIPLYESDSPLGNWLDLRPLGTEGQGLGGYAKPYSLVTLAIPAGVGVRWRLTPNLNLSAEVGFRYTLTDYLDDVGGLYPDSDAITKNLSILFSDRRYEYLVARTGQDRLEALQNLPDVTPDVHRGTSGYDMYMLTQIKLHYLLPVAIKCPVDRR
ncbi:DUF6089 family protein [Spirosoma utsteinense]|uniref:DUF6089 domain-containing protein n=1 Tax=Spirosoma utsteinense TaxID=2585773 RepID=A0ABR6W2Q3_9BACT|nr:DUF6089 family protein [Spirosoma utsteinense]MBC3784332.1 hypothetical protein [Spirosoma utsteinense]MBC3790869.1 hypothetical protein [Spirosoma utsteinense]